MKTLLLTIALLAANGQAWAQDFEDNAPLLDSGAPLGRLQMYETLNGGKMYVPIVFDQTFHCSNTGVCSLKIYNRLSQLESNGLSAIASSGQSVLGFRADLYDAFIKVNSQKLTGEISTLQDNFFAGSNLAILEFSYGQAFFKSSSPDTLNGEYAHGSIGRFEVDYTLKGAVRDFSIRIPRTALVTFLDNWPNDGVSFAQVKDLIKSNLTLQSTGYQRDDVNTIVAYEFKRQLLRSVGSGKFALDPEKKAAILQMLSGLKSWVIGETLIHASQNCRANLEIKSDSIVTQTCGDANEDI